MSLVMDYCLPGEDKWQRIDVDNAREELRANAPPAYPRSSTSNAADVGVPSRTWGAPAQASSVGTSATDQEGQRCEDPSMETDAHT